MDKDTRTPVSHCLNCNYRVDAALSLEGKTPTPGSLSVCMMCGAVAAYDDKLAIRALTEEEISDIQSDTELLRYLKRIVGAILFMRAEKAREN